MNENTYWVYILHCENGSYYTGYTTDLARRYAEHLQGTAKCKYTRSFKPTGIARCWQIAGDKAMAMQIEQFIKKRSKAEKERLINNPDQLGTMFPCANVAFPSP